MTVSVLTAVTDAGWEADLVAALGHGEHGVTVVRRCVDVADLLAAAAARTAEAVVLSADLRRLDRDVLGRLEAVGVAVVGLVEPGDEEAERRLRQLGVAVLLRSDATPEEVAGALRRAAAGAADRPAGDYGDPLASLAERVGPVEEPPDPAGRGRVVAVWGPTGAPGRTTVAVGVADEASRLGVPTLLIDADVYGGSCAQVLGLLDEAPGLAGACRLDAGSRLDVPALAGLAVSVGPWLRVLTGIVRPDRWPELRPDAVRRVLDLARRLALLVVVDCGFALEQDEELAYDTLAPRRNGATLAVLQSADTILAVGGADPVGLHRLVRGLADLGEAVPGAQPRVVVNRVRRGVTPGDPRREITAALRRHAGVTEAVLLPYDRAATDAALGSGQPLAAAAPASPLRRALVETAAWLGGVPVPAKSRRRAG